MTVTFNIRPFTDMSGNRTVEVAVESMNAQSNEIGFAKGLVETVEKFVTEYGKEKD